MQRAERDRPPTAETPTKNHHRTGAITVPRLAHIIMAALATALILAGVALVILMVFNPHMLL